VPNHQCHLYDRLWCVFELFVAREQKVPIRLANTLAAVGTGNSAKATCSNQEDKERIDAMIMYGITRSATIPDKTRRVDYHQVDESIKRLRQHAHVEGFCSVIFWGLCPAWTGGIWQRLQPGKELSVLFAGYSGCWSAFASSAFIGAYCFRGVEKRKKKMRADVVTKRGLLCFTGSLMGVGVVLLVFTSLARNASAHADYRLTSFFGAFGITLIAIGGSLILVRTLIAIGARRGFQHRRMFLFCCYMFGILLFVGLLVHISPRLEFDQLMPSMVQAFWQTVLGVSFLAIPWRFAVQWGVKFSDERAVNDEKKARDAVLPPITEETI